MKREMMIWRRKLLGFRRYSLYFMYCRRNCMVKNMGYLSMWRIMRKLVFRWGICFWMIMCGIRFKRMICFKIFIRLGGRLWIMSFIAGVYSYSSSKIKIFIWRKLGFFAGRIFRNCRREWEMKRCCRICWCFMLRIWCICLLRILDRLSSFNRVGELNCSKMLRSFGAFWRRNFN